MTQQEPTPSTTPEAPNRPPHEIETDDEFTKTLAFKISEDTHAQLQFIAQLRGGTVAAEARRALRGHLDAVRQDADLIARAEHARKAIEREAVARANAIAGFMGTTATTPATAGKQTADSSKGSRGQRPSPRT